MKRLNNLLLFFFIFLLPTQFGKHFFFNFSYLSGIRVDYLSPTIYLIDIIVFLLTILNLKNIVDFLKKPTVLIILILFFINLLMSQSKPISIYRYLRWLEFFIIFAIFNKKNFDKTIIFLGFFCGGLLEIILVCLQFINQHAIQGVFYFFGERYMNLSTPGVAKTSFGGIEIMRPYGTFSHPNSLGGFYLLLYFYFLLNKKFDEFFILKNVSLLIFSLLILLSFSKICILIFLFLNTFYWLRFKKNCPLCLLAKVVAFLIVGLIFLQFRGDPLTLDKRLELFKNALIIILNKPVFGVGMGNYLLAQEGFPSRLPYFFQQPVHNVFLLFLAECGLFGLFIVSLSFFLIKKFLKSKIFVYCLLVFLITGVFDHYWLTLYQNFFLLGVVFSLITTD
ncbi:MAG: O-antigen ligase family protein [Microgenomates group bacterium]|nr:O-antigen ligase family protein [Microgenomates group bacterium]